MKSTDIVKKFGAGGSISVEEAIFDMEDMKFKSIHGIDYHQNGEIESYIFNNQEFSLLMFVETEPDIQHCDTVYIKTDICKDGSEILSKSPFLFITKEQGLNRVVNEDGNTSCCRTDIEGKFKNLLITSAKKLYVNTTFFRTNFPVVRVYEIKERAEIDPDKIYFELETIMLPLDANNIIIRAEAYEDIFKKIFDSRAYGGYTETYKHKVLTKFAPATNIVEDIDIYKVKE